MNYSAYDTYYGNYIHKNGRVFVSSDPAKVERLMRKRVSPYFILVAVSSKLVV